MRIPFQINSRGKELLGILHIADKQYTTPVVVIMCYGLNGNRVEQHRMSVKFGELCERGSVNLIRFDYANVGISEGNFFFSSLSERVDNVIDIYNFVSGCFNKDLFIFLVGFSDGAKMAIQARNYIKDIRGLIFWNPMINITQNVGKLNTVNSITEKMKLHKKYKKPYKQLFGTCLNTKIIKEIESDKSLENLKGEDDKLFVFGGNDRFTQKIREFVTTEGLHNSKTVIIDDSGHLFGKTTWEKQVNDITLKWIQECVNEY